jgi:hypothetical protein
MSSRGPDYDDLIAREIVRRASDDELVRTASTPAVASLALGVVGWIGAACLLLLVLALGGCVALIS